MSILKLFAQNKLIILFGFTTLFCVGLGQTFFIAQFNHFFIKDLGISRTELSSFYSLATFLASFNLSYIGSLLDKISLRKYLILILFFMSLGFIIIANSYNSLMIFIGFYLLRGFGQVPLGLMATTTAARLYGKHRGKILMLMGFGRSSSEGILPLICILLFASFTWRESLLIFMGILLLLMLPMLFFIIPKIPSDTVYEENPNSTNTNIEVFTWKEVFKQRWPLLVMCLNAFVPFVMTALFFQQDTIATAKGWNISLMAKSFSAFSLVHIFGNIIWGPLIDRFSARKLQPFSLLPFFIGLILLYCFDFENIVFIYMGFVGLSIGLGGMIRNTFWAEVYGIKILGKIKGMDSNIIVIGTSIAPIFYSLLMDFGFQIQEILFLFIAMTALAMIGYMAVYFHYRSYR
jgi:MFS family permease